MPVPEEGSGVPQIPVIGIGVDIISVDRLAGLFGKYPPGAMLRYFTDREALYCTKKMHRYQHFAGKLAAKEAVSKALKMTWEKGLSLRDIEILNRASVPYVVLSGQAEDRARRLHAGEIMISISHCRSHAVAMAVVTAGPAGLNPMGLHPS